MHLLRPIIFQIVHCGNLVSAFVESQNIGFQSLSQFEIILIAFMAFSKILFLYFNYKITPQYYRQLLQQQLLSPLFLIISNLFSSVLIFSFNQTVSINVFLLEIICQLAQFRFLNQIIINSQLSIFARNSIALAYSIATGIIINQSFNLFQVLRNIAICCIVLAYLYSLWNLAEINQSIFVKKKSSDLTTKQDKDLNKQGSFAPIKVENHSHNWIDQIQFGIMILNQCGVVTMNKHIQTLLKTYNEQETLKNLNKIQICSTDKSFKKVLNNLQNKNNAEDSVRSGNPSIGSAKLSYTLQEIIQAIFATKYKQVVNLALFESDFIQSDEYLLQIHILDFEHDFQLAIFILPIKDRDDIINRKFTYKITKKLFKSFEHEFATSLNCILSLAQASISDSTIPHKLVKKYFLPILNSSKLMNSLVDDMRDYNKILGKQFKINLNTFCAVNLLTEVINLFDLQIVGKKLQVDLHINEQLSEINNDRERVKQVLINLLSNAIKFSQQGKIDIIAENVVINERTYARFTVKDNGCGMKKSEQFNLSNFLQSKLNGKAISKYTAGFGLGLYISNFISKCLSRIKYENGGGIQFTSEQDKGSIFSFLVWNIEKGDKIFQSSSVLSNHSPMVLVDRNIVIDRKVSKFSTNILMNPLQKKFITVKSTFQEKETIVQTFKRQFVSRHSSPISYQSKKFNSLQSAEIHYIQSPNFHINTNTNTQNLNNNILNTPDNNTRQNINTNTSQMQLAQINDEFNNSFEKYEFTNRQWYFQTAGNLISPFDKLQRISTDNIMRSRCKDFKVLIVDDELLNIIGLQLLLEQLDIQSEYALYGYQCIDMIQERESNHHKVCDCGFNGYRVIFMDINMPQMDGFQTTEQILSLATRNIIQLPIIVACTAYTDLKTKSQCYQTGMKYFLSKPIQREILEQCGLDLGLL